MARNNAACPEFLYPIAERELAALRGQYQTIHISASVLAAFGVALGKTVIEACSVFSANNTW